jgi:hypothetical protein
LAFSLGSGSVTRQRPNNEVMRSFVGSVARQRPVSNNGVVFSLESVPRARCYGNIVLLIQGGPTLTLEVSQSQSQVKVTLRPTTSRSVSLVSRPIWVSWPDINFCLTFTVLSMSGPPL